MPDDDLGCAAPAETEHAVKIVEVNNIRTIVLYLYIYLVSKKTTEIKSGAICALSYHFLVHPSPNRHKYDLSFKNIVSLVAISLLPK